MVCVLCFVRCTREREACHVYVLYVHAVLVRVQCNV